MAEYSSRSSSESEDHERSQTKKKTTWSSRFTAEQRAILDLYYLSGMVGTGKQYSGRHEQAAKEVEWTVEKVKVHFLGGILCTSMP